jgi:hypothetical protein
MAMREMSEFSVGAGLALALGVLRWSWLQFMVHL